MGAPVDDSANDDDLFLVACLLVVFRGDGVLFWWRVLPRVEMSVFFCVASSVFTVGIVLMLLILILPEGDDILDLARFIFLSSFCDD